MRRLRVTDRSTGAIVAEVSAPPPPPDQDPLQEAFVLPLGHGALEVVVDGWRFELVVEDADRADLRDRATSVRTAAARDEPLDIHAIIPGRVVSVAVVAGDEVTAGSRLLAIEAMKMENDVRAPRDGVVERMAVGVGETVDLGDLLVTLR